MATVGRDMTASFAAGLDNCQGGKTQAGKSRSSHLTTPTILLILYAVVRQSRMRGASDAALPFEHHVSLALRLGCSLRNHTGENSHRGPGNDEDGFSTTACTSGEYGLCRCAGPAGCRRGSLPVST